MDLIELINKVPTVAAWHTGLREQAPITNRSSWIGKTLAITGVYQAFQKQVIVVTPNLYYTNQLAEDLRNVTKMSMFFQWMKCCQPKWLFLHQKHEKNEWQR